MPQPTLVATPERLVDCIHLHAALEAGRRAALDQDQLEEGGHLARLLDEDFQACLRQSFEPIIERPEAGVFRSLYNRMTTQGAVGPQRFALYGEFLAKFLPWVKSRLNLVEDLFPGRSRRTFLLVVAALEEETPAAQLHKLAGIPTLSGYHRIRKWAEEAAAQLGAPISDMDSVKADAETATALAEKVRDVQTALEVSDSMTEEAADLQDQKAALTQHIQDVAQESVDPSAVMGAATAATSAQPTSQIARKAKLNDEQTKAMLAEGRVVITAGAGAGKTSTMAAKIAYMVEERGYRPDQIMATSFTKKSAKELAEKVARNYGITDARIGTTHNIAGEIIRYWGTSAEREAARKASTNAPNMLMLIAIAQIGMRQDHGHDRGGWGGGYRRAADELVDPLAETDKPKAEGGGGGGKSPWWDKAAGQWFNLGQVPVDSKGKPLSTRALSAQVGLFKAHNVTVEEAWAKHRSDRGGGLQYFASAAYGAYEWLKRNDPKYAPCMDFDDWLLVAVDILEDKTVPAAEVMQNKYRVVIVDESQDLNQVQWRMFNAIAAKADTFAVVGDDAQAIYSFRGAVPEEFIDLPKKGFSVQTMTINYRSGKNIVEAANRLIAYNEDRQIKKECRANPSRLDEGIVKSVRTDDHKASAEYAAQEIAAMISPESGFSPADFGILVRNNNEADEFALSLMIRGIPFRSKINYFNRPAVRNMVAWLTLAAGGSDDELNTAALTAHRTPTFFLSNAFADGLRNKAGRGVNYRDYLLSGKPVYDGRDDWRNGRMVRPYGEAIRKLMAKAEESTETLIRAVLELQGPGGTFMESLVDDVNPEEVAKEFDTIEPTEEMIRTAAVAPLNPLFKMAQQYADPRKFLDFVAKMVKANDRSRKDDDSPEPAVLVDTVHQWKGLEARHVYVSMAEGVFPNFYASKAYAEGDVTALDDERRLAYVAITRGQESVTVLSPARNYLGRDCDASVFISEACIPSENAAAVEAPAEENIRTASAVRGYRFLTPLVAALDRELALAGVTAQDDPWADPAAPNPQPMVVLETQGPETELGLGVMDPDMNLEHAWGPTMWGDDD